MPICNKPATICKLINNHMPRQGRIPIFHTLQSLGHAKLIATLFELEHPRIDLDLCRIESVYFLIQVVVMVDVELGDFARGRW